MKKKRNVKRVLFRLVVFAFVVYTGVKLVNIQIRLTQKENQLASLKRQVAAQTAQNKKAEHLLRTDSIKQFTQSIARDELDYAKPGERVFINASGN